MLLLWAFLPLSLRLSLIVQQQVRVVVTLAVGHHHCADGASIDVLDLEKALDHVDVLRFNILAEERKRMKRRDETVVNLEMRHIREFPNVTELAEYITRDTDSQNCLEN